MLETSINKSMEALDKQDTYPVRKFNKQIIAQGIGFALLRVCVAITLFILIYILYDIISKGYTVLSWDFLTANPTNGMTEGGIFPAILGTILLTLITTAFSVPLGMFTAIYLNEYSRPGIINRIIRMSIRNLAGVPSIVFGLFGIVFFVQIMNIRPSLLAAGLTLALLTLPVTITSSEEALKTVPDSYREGSLALGSTKWQMIRTVVLPFSIPGMMTGAILSLSRAAGETAPILVTGAAFFLPYLPNSIFSRFMALPYHLYIMATQHHSIAQVRPLAYGTAFVLVALIVILNLAATLLRSHFRRKYKA